MSDESFGGVAVEMFPEVISGSPGRDEAGEEVAAASLAAGGADAGAAAVEVTVVVLTLSSSSYSS